MQTKRPTYVTTLQQTLLALAFLGINSLVSPTVLAQCELEIDVECTEDLPSAGDVPAPTNEPFVETSEEKRESATLDLLDTASSKSMTSMFRSFRDVTLPVESYYPPNSVKTTMITTTQSPAVQVSEYLELPRTVTTLVKSAPDISGYETGDELTNPTKFASSLVVGISKQVVAETTQENTVVSPSSALVELSNQNAEIAEDLLESIYDDVAEKVKKIATGNYSSYEASKRIQEITELVTNVNSTGLEKVVDQNAKLQASLASQADSGEAPDKEPPKPAKPAYQEKAQAIEEIPTSEGASLIWQSEKSNEEFRRLNPSYDRGPDPRHYDLTCTNEDLKPIIAYPQPEEPVVNPPLATHFEINFYPDTLLPPRYEVELNIENGDVSPKEADAAFDVSFYKDLMAREMDCWLGGELASVSKTTTRQAVALSYAVPSIIPLTLPGEQSTDVLVLLQSALQAEALQDLVSADVSASRLRSFIETHRIATLPVMWMAEYYAASSLPEGLSFSSNDGIRIVDEDRLYKLAGMPYDPLEFATIFEDQGSTYFDVEGRISVRNSDDQILLSAVIETSGMQVSDEGVAGWTWPAVGDESALDYVLEVTYGGGLKQALQPFVAAPNFKLAVLERTDVVPIISRATGVVTMEGRFFRPAYTVNPLSPALATYARLTAGAEGLAFWEQDVNSDGIPDYVLLSPEVGSQVLYGLQR